MRALILKSAFYSTALDLMMIILVVSTLVLSGAKMTPTLQSTIELLGKLHSRGAYESEVLAQLGPPPAFAEVELFIPLDEKGHRLSWCFSEESLNSIQYSIVMADFNIENKLIHVSTNTLAITGDEAWQCRWHRLLYRLGIEQH